MSDVDIKIKSNDILNAILNDYKNNLNSNKCVTFLNPFSYYRYIDSGVDQYFTDLFIDGSFLEFIHNYKYKTKVKRASFDFSSIASDVFEFSSKHNIPISLIGGSNDEINSVIKYLSLKYPKVDFSIFHSGFFEQTTQDKLISEISKYKGKRIIIFGMGTPLQEQKIVEFVNLLSENDFLYFTCGGFITQTSIRTDYYNPIVKKLGLRWLQRAIEFPHVRKRLLFDYPKFLYRYLREHYGR